MHTKNFQKEEISRFQLRININHLNLSSEYSPISFSPGGGGCFTPSNSLFFFSTYFTFCYNFPGRQYCHHESLASIKTHILYVQLEA